MGMEDIVQVNTLVGKGLVGFILKKVLEKNLGVKFENFEVSELNGHGFGSSEVYSFSIGIQGNISKGEVLKIVRGDKE